MLMMKLTPLSVELRRFGADLWAFIMESEPTLQTTFNTYIMGSPNIDLEYRETCATYAAMVCQLYSVDELRAWFVRFRNNTSPESYPESVHEFYTRVVLAADRIAPYVKLVTTRFMVDEIPVNFRFTQPTIELRQILREELGPIGPLSQ